MHGVRTALLSIILGCVTATPTAACRIPWRFVPANETHEVVLVATAVSRSDWGAYSYDAGWPVDRATGEMPTRMHGREWSAVLRTVTVLKGEAPDVIQVSPDIPDENGEVVISSCWDGITTPQPGETYAVYLDRGNGALAVTRLVELNFSLANDPLFSMANSPPNRTR